MKWYATCILYGDLNIYSELVTSVKIHNWWIVTQKIPRIFKSLSSIMAILMGDNPMVSKEISNLNPANFVNQMTKKI